MKKTTNYKLPRWEKDDFVKMDDFNAAFQTIDETLKAGADAVADEAAARETAVTALQEKWSCGKVCRIKYGNYTGTGTYGLEQPVSISCDFVPAMLVIVTPDGTTGINPPRLAIRNYSKLQPQGSYGTNLITWSNTSLSWYGGSAEAQFNSAGYTYYYVVLGYDE